MEHHPTKFVIEGFSIFCCVEVSVGLTPTSPAPNESMDHLTSRVLWSSNWLAIIVELRSAVIIYLRNAGLAEVLAHHDVGGELAPLRGDLGVVHFKYN